MGTKKIDMVPVFASWGQDLMPNLLVRAEGKVWYNQQASSMFVVMEAPGPIILRNFALKNYFSAFVRVLGSRDRSLFTNAQRYDLDAMLDAGELECIVPLTQLVRADHLERKNDSEIRKKLVKQRAFNHTKLNRYVCNNDKFWQTFVVEVSSFVDGGNASKGCGLDLINVFGVPQQTNN